MLQDQDAIGYVISKQGEHGSLLFLLYVYRLQDQQAAALCRSSMHAAGQVK